MRLPTLVVRGVLALVALLPAACASPPRATSRATSRAPASPRVVGYLASWGVRSKGTRIPDLPADRLTHVLYAFVRVGPDLRVALADPCLDVGRCARVGDDGATDSLGGNFAQLLALKQRHPHLRILPSVGGWGGSARFSDAALTEASRRAFAASAVDLVARRWPGLFDGFDVDWEFPVSGGMAGNVERPADRENFVLLLAELRRQLDAQSARDGRRYELAIAASAGPRGIANLELARIAPLLDFITVMTYDYHAGSRVAHLNAPLFAAAGDPTPALSVDASIRAYLAGGVPAHKLLVGVPFYGRAYGGVASANAGLYQPSTGLPVGWREGEGDYRTLARSRVGSPHFQRHWSAEAQVPWLFNPASGTWITYDDSQSVAAKADYVRTRRLGGLAIWELGGDDGTLMRALSAGLRGTRD